jgi:hypothetical protein
LETPKQELQRAMRLAVAVATTTAGRKESEKRCMVLAAGTFVKLNTRQNTNTNTVGLKPSSPALASEQICSWGFAQSVGTCPLHIRLGNRNHPHKYVNSSTQNTAASFTLGALLVVVPGLLQQDCLHLH